MEDIKSKVIELVGRSAVPFNDSPNTDIFETSALGALGFDSLDYVELALDLEETFPGISIDDDFLTAETTVGQVHAYVAEQLTRDRRK